MISGVGMTLLIMAGVLFTGLLFESF